MTRNRLAFAACFGVAVTLLTLGAAFWVASAGLDSLARTLFWPNSVLQSLITPLNIGTVEHPVYEGSPLNIMAFVLSVPFGFILYGAAAYIALGIWGRR